MSDETYGLTPFDGAQPELEDLLAIARPVPPPAFRGRLGRHLAERDPGYGPRPERLRRFVASYLGAGGLLIACVALGLS